MKAALIHKYGPPDVFRLEDTPTPEPGPNDLLIEVHASSVNPVDYNIRQGGQRGAIRYKLPHILGLDLSGVVVKVGAKVEEFQPGDEVYSSPNHLRQGTYAEYTVIDASAVALKPQNLSHQEAASIPLVGLTAWEALVVKGALKPQQKILIQAGSGGVGTFAIQLAKHLEAEVFTTCSARNIPLVSGLGADHVIDYTSVNFDDVCRDLDLVLDALGEPHQSRALKTLRRGGHLAALNAGLPENTKTFGPFSGLLITGIQIARFKLKARLHYGVSSSQILRQTRGALLSKITPLLEEGIIKPIIDRAYPLEHIAEAHRYIETGRARGKIVITVK